jgi:hypothetical protein
MEAAGDFDGARYVEFEEAEFRVLLEMR